MAAPNYAVFKYDHTDRLKWAWLHRIVVAVWGIAVFVAFFLIGPLAFALLIALIIYSAVVAPKKKILLGVRYLLCGNTILYYRNVRRMKLSEGKELTLFWGESKFLKVEQERFPTNARKSEKIAKNKTAKFEKVSRKIIDRVLLASPDVELLGIDRDQWLAERKPT
jgi:hypothetical protein